MVNFCNFSMQGEGPKKHDCQDAFTIIDNNPSIFHFFAVFDGHGSSGKEASNAACDNFQQYFEKKLENIKKLNDDKKRDKFLKGSFKFTENKLKICPIFFILYLLRDPIFRVLSNLVIFTKRIESNN